MHTKEDIDKVKEEMPNKVGVLKGATEIHELLFEPNGKIKMKKLPNETLYKPVTIKVGNKITRRGGERERLNQAFVNETADELELEETVNVDSEEETEEEENDDMRSCLRSRRRAVQEVHADINYEDGSEIDEDED